MNPFDELSIEESVRIREKKRHPAGVEDILALKLNADWVVLSACNTAAGADTGAEAVSGLGRAFFYAGSRALLATNMDLNPLRRDWFERLRERVIEAGAGTLTPEAWATRVPDLIASSDAIRYLHLGNPEAILLSSQPVLDQIEAISDGRKVPPQPAARP